MNIARRFLLGRYLSGDSVIHKLDSRVKIFFLFLVSISLFFVNSITEYILPFVLLLAVIYLSKIKFAIVIKGIIPIFWLTGFTFFFHAVIPPHNINTGILICSRILLLFGWASVLTASTPAVELGKAIAWYLKPFKIFGISSKSAALTFSLALRFFPIILEEADGVIRAQQLRGENLSIKKRLENFCTVFFVRILKKANNIEIILNNRDFTEEKLDNIFNYKKLRLSEAGAILFGFIFAGVMVFCPF